MIEDILHLCQGSFSSCFHSIMFEAGRGTWLQYIRDSDTIGDMVATVWCQCMPMIRHRGLQECPLQDCRTRPFGNGCGGSSMGGRSKRCVRPMCNKPALHDHWPEALTRCRSCSAWSVSQLTSSKRKFCYCLLWLTLGSRTVQCTPQPPARRS